MVKGVLAIALDGGGMKEWAFCFFGIPLSAEGNNQSTSK